eukprot:SAG25_NODE_7882_length_452_cov_0.872521_1_plen_116_part_01
MPICTCDHGVAVLYPACTTNMEKCAVCGAGYVLSGNACIAVSNCYFESDMTTARSIAAHCGWRLDQFWVRDNGALVKATASAVSVNSRPRAARSGQYFLNFDSKHAPNSVVSTATS